MSEATITERKQLQAATTLRAPRDEPFTIWWLDDTGRFEARVCGGDFYNAIHVVRTTHDNGHVDVKAWAVLAGARFPLVTVTAHDTDDEVLEFLERYAPEVAVDRSGLPV